MAEDEERNGGKSKIGEITARVEEKEEEEEEM